jgi:eukaryotic-like serine/threonine-protein kinase
MKGPDRLTLALADRYRLERELGQGGMATVYLAADLKHDRKVAIKVLKPELAAVLGAERFLAEIKTTATLQHPHILALFDSGQVEGTVFYVMPFVDGESLRDRLEREKQLSIEDALLIAREVGDALQYAHGHGVIHRDIKPENILLHGGHALVADFGIALAAAKTGDARMTETGMSLGTPTYMSPEQAMGERTLDARSDVYALGCVLYEMLAGEAPFTGATAQAIVAKVLTEKPAPIVARRSRVPEFVEDAVLTALEKLPADRFATAAEFVRALSPGAGGTGATPARARASVDGSRAWRIATGALALVTVALVVALGLLARGGEAPQPRRFEVQRGDVPAVDPARQSRATRPTVIAGAPDGSSYVYCSSTGAVLLRRWESLTPTPLTGSLEGCVAAAYSPDGSSVAVVGIPTGLYIFTVRGAAPSREIPIVSLGDMSTAGGGMDWAANGNLYIATGRQVARVAPDNGTIEVASRADSSTFYYGIDVLPGERTAVVVTAKTAGATLGDARVRLLDLQSGAMDSLTTGAAARYIHPGRLLVARSDGSLVVAPFDPRTGQTRGIFAVLPDTVGTAAFAGYQSGQLDVAADGTLFYVGSVARSISHPVFVSRSGLEAPVFDDWTGIFRIPRLAPDASRLAIETGDDEGRNQLAVRDLRTGASRRLEPRAFLSGRHSWMPDGRGLWLVSDRDGEKRLYEWRLESDLATIVRRYVPRAPNAVEWSRDGRWVLVRTDDQAAGKADILALRPGIDTVARPILASPEVSEYAPSLSPDSRWLAYVADEGGRYDVRVTSFPDARERWQVSVAGGSEPVWSGDGRELFYVADDGFMMVATIAPGADFRVVGQRRLFSVAPYDLFGIWNRNYDVTRDGQRFLMLRRDNNAPSSVIVVQNWAVTLAKNPGGR